LSDVADFMVEEIGDDCLTRNESSRNSWSVHVSRNGHAEIIRSLWRKINFEFINQFLKANFLNLAFFLVMWLFCSSNHETGNPSYPSAVADEFTVHSRKLLKRANIMNS
jgi:hypothetical protein